MKKILVVFLTLILLGGVASASPLMDYSRGKGAVDLNWYVDSSMGFPAGRYDGKNGNIDFGATVGLGNDFALQYRQFNPKTRVLPNDWAKIETSEANVLYKLDKGVALFVGYHKAQYVNDVGPKDAQHTFQGGLIFETALAPKIDGYAVVGFSQDFTNYEIGAAYRLADNLDFDVKYRKIEEKHTKLNGQNYMDAIKAYGVSVGLTYKF